MTLPRSYCGCRPISAAGTPVVHADVEIHHHEDRRLQPLGEVEAISPNRKSPSDLSETAALFGVAVGGIGAKLISVCCVRVGMPVEGPPR